LINSGLDHWLSTLGYIAVALFVGVEGIGIPLPGETMLITAAVFAAEGNLSIVGVIAAAAAGAVIGNFIGFGVGWFGGYPLLRRFGKYVRLNEPQVKVGRYIFMRYGSKVVFVGRFVSILRTYLAFLAGANRMPWPKFLLAITAGAIVWATVYGVGAYALGSQISHLSLPVEIAFIALAVLAIIAGIIFIRVAGRRLEATAEAAFPGPLEGYPKEAPGDDGPDDRPDDRSERGVGH
jgi:membrane protein DedA with SNARE-associated domain